jgi:hypothetical protein
MSENAWSAADLREMIRKRYPAPEWVTLFEVANGTGASQSRWADAVAMNLWPSRGMAVHGFEIKVSRTDWQKELSQPEKANDVARFCDFWWLAAPEAIVKSGELPLGWGHLAPENDKLKVVANAAQMKPEPLTRHFVGALLRNQSGANEADIERRARVRVAALRAEDERRIKQEIEHRTYANADAVKFLDELAAELGLDTDGVRSWSRNDETMAALRLVAKTNLKNMSWLLSSARTAAEHLLKALDGIDPIKEKPKRGRAP